MAPSRKAPRYAHSDGHTGICYSTDGKNLITCGSEGDIRIWHGFEDDDPTEKCVGEKAFAVAQVGDKLYVGTDHNNVQAFTFPGADLDRICTRFTAPVTCISIVKDWLVAGSSDMKVHAFNLSSGAEKVIACHNGPILEVALDPQLEYLATSCCDGLIRVFSMDSIVTSEEASPLQTWPDFIPKSNDFETSPVSARVAWSPNENRWLAIPHAGKVHLYDTGSWLKAFSLAFDECEFQVVRFSPCGLYLAAGGSAGNIVVWSLTDRRVLYVTQERAAGGTTSKICGLAWHPGDSSQLAYCDTEGQLGLIEQLLDPASPPLTNGYTESHESILAPDEIGEAMLIDNDDEDGEEDENEISLDKIKAQSGFIPDDQEGAGDPILSPVPDEDRGTPISGIYAPVGAAPLTELQPAFQPTSTPAHFQYRFMVYNDVGMVRQTNTEEENSIDVEFHDSSVHHSFRINNVIGHSLAALSTKALVLACERDEDKPSKLSCIVINSWDGSKEWSTEMPDEEEILAVAAGDTFVAAATDRNLLRIFSVGGLQREVVSLPGPVVCLNARDSQLVAVCHSGQGVPGDQSLCCSIFHTGALTRSRGPLLLPLSPRGTLRWAGLSEEGSLLSLDSEGVLRLCQRFSGGATVWRPVCFLDDLTKGKSDHYFLVGVTETSHQVRCILCKGSFYPATVPRPILTQVSWKIPLCEPASEKSELEEQFWRKHLAMSSVPSSKTEELASIMREVIAPAVKLFALSCKTDHDLRAVELCELFSTPQFLQLAARYASSTGKPGLAERVADLTNPAATGPAQARSPSPSQQLASDPGYGQSQNDTVDMFGDDSYQPRPDSSNIILAMKQQQVVIRPQNVVLGRLNPFKRATSGGDERPRSDTIAEMTSKSQPKPASTAAAAHVTENKSSAAGKDKSSPKPPIKFAEWFSREKENLESEFPDLDKPALNKVAMKRFKEVHSQKTTPAAAAPQANSVRNFFSLGRKQDSQPLPTVDSQNSQDTTVVIPSSQDTNNENENAKKKRKLEEKDDVDSANPKKPLTAANKLKAFSFSK